MKKWNVGVADEDWKVAICERDMRSARQIVEMIECVIGDDIEKFTGAEIKAALVAYSERARKSIAAGALDLTPLKRLEISALAMRP